MTMKEIGGGWGGDAHPLHSSLIPPEKLHKLHVSGSPQLDLPLPAAEPGYPRRGGGGDRRQLLDMGKKPIT